MKNFTLSVATVLALSTFAVAGGDIAPVEPMVEAVAPATDDSGFYIGGAISFVNSQTDARGEEGEFDLIDGSQYWWTESGETDNTGFMLQAGYQFNKYIAVEGRYWNAKSETKWAYAEGYAGEPAYFTDSMSDECGDLTAWGIYLKPMYPVTESLSVYGLLGYGSTEIDEVYYGVQTGPNTWSGPKVLDESGFQWGLGASYAYDEHLSFFVDYVQLATDEGGSFDWVAADDSRWDYDYVNWETSVYTINLGVSYKF